MTLTQVGIVLLIDIMSEADLIDITPLTTAFLQTLDGDSIAAVRRYAKASRAARFDYDDYFQDPDFFARHDALLAGVAAYNDGITSGGH
jgi:hypothetical protein